MEYLQNLSDGSAIPILTAFLLGLLTALSPCPLATNIAAVGYISKDLENRRRVFFNGLLYTLGRVAAYTLLGAVLIAVLRGGAGVFAIQKVIGKWGEMLIGPVLVLIGSFMLFGHRLDLPKFGFSGRGGQVGRRGGWGAFLLGVLFSLAFCPTSGVFYFGMLIPMSAAETGGYLRGGRRMDLGIRRRRAGDLLQPDAGDSKMAHADCGPAFYSRRYLLWCNLFLLKR